MQVYSVLTQLPFAASIKLDDFQPFTVPSKGWARLILEKTHQSSLDKVHAYSMRFSEKLTCRVMAAVLFPLGLLSALFSSKIAEFYFELMYEAIEGKRLVYLPEKTSNKKPTFIPSSPNLKTPPIQKLAPQTPVEDAKKLWKEKYDSLIGHSLVSKHSICEALKELQRLTPDAKEEKDAMQKLIDQLPLASHLLFANNSDHLREKMKPIADPAKSKEFEKALEELFQIIHEALNNGKLGDLESKFNAFNACLQKTSSRSHDNANEFYKAFKKLTRMAVKEHTASLEKDASRLDYLMEPVDLDRDFLRECFAGDLLAMAGSHSKKLVCQKTEDGHTSIESLASTFYQEALGIRDFKFQSRLSQLLAHGIAYLYPKDVEMDETKREESINGFFNKIQELVAKFNASPKVKGLAQESKEVLEKLNTRMHKTCGLLQDQLKKASLLACLESPTFCHLLAYFVVATDVYSSNVYNDARSLSEVVIRSKLNFLNTDWFFKHKKGLLKFDKSVGDGAAVLDSANIKATIHGVISHKKTDPESFSYIV